MIKIKVIAILSLFLICGCSNDDIETMNSKSSKVTIKTDENLLLENVNNISSNKRDWGSDGEIKTSKYLEGKLKGYGYIVNIEEFPIYKQNRELYYHDFFNLNPYNADSIGKGRHVIAKHPNYDKNKKTLYLTAHYDSDKKFDTIGVIDNATGTAAVLEIARVLKDYELPFNLEVILFSAEEYGLYGSRYFTSNLSQKEKSNILGSINLDMIGEKDAGELIVQAGKGYNNVLSLMVKDKFGDEFKLLQGGNSDEFPFYKSKIPAITFSNEHSKTFDGDNQFDFLDVEQLKSTCNIVIDFITTFDTATYWEFVEDKKSYDLQLTNPNINNLENYKLLSVKETLIENGYDSDVTYIYEDSKGISYELKEKDSGFIPLDSYKDFNVLDKDNNSVYKVSKEGNSSENIEILYRWGGIYGVLKSEASLEDSLEFLDNYYIAYYENLFGNKPTNSILD